MKPNKIFISVIYGSKKNKGQYLQNLYYEIFNNINKLIYRVENDSIVEKVKAEKKYNIEGVIISLILQEVENNILESLLEFFNYKGFIPKINNRFIVSSIFDGFQILKNDGINSDVLKQAEEYAKFKTGNNVNIKIKPFNSNLILPDNYELEFNYLRYTTILKESEDNTDGTNNNQNNDNDGANIIQSPDDDEGASQY